jgi:hypothetical protein
VVVAFNCIGAGAMSKPLTSQDLDQCFRELLWLRAQVRKAERDIEESAKLNLKEPRKLVVERAVAPVVFH